MSNNRLPCLVSSGIGGILYGAMLEGHPLFMPQGVPGRSPVKDPPVRLDGNLGLHLLKHLPPTRRDRTPTRNCRVCIRNKKRSETRFYCAICRVPMHSGVCYIRYHTMVKY
ncbi:PiggyBac transposable element-derived protein 4 [Blattella germanica]|nr:PiggyBac transposable element-derived protein 4 [Blattella germanica]